MRLNNVVVVAKREYLQRAKTKAFWITTLILPLFVAAISIVPSVLMMNSKSTQRIVVVDATGKVGADLVRLLNTKEEQTRPGESKGLKRNGGEGITEFEATAEPPAADSKAQQAAL